MQACDCPANMTGRVKGIPDGASVVIPRLVCRDPAAAIAFCVKTFEAADLGGRPGLTERWRMRC